MNAISNYRGNRPTNTHTNAVTNPQTHRQDQLQYTALLSLARSAKIWRHAVKNLIDSGKIFLSS